MKSNGTILQNYLLLALGICLTSLPLTLSAQPGPSYLPVLRGTGFEEVKQQIGGPHYFARAVRGRLYADGRFVPSERTNLAATWTGEQERIDAVRAMANWSNGKYVTRGHFNTGKLSDSQQRHFTEVDRHERKTSDGRTEIWIAVALKGGVGIADLANWLSMEALLDPGKFTDQMVRAYFQRMRDLAIETGVLPPEAAAHLDQLGEGLVQMRRGADPLSVGLSPEDWASRRDSLNQSRELLAGFLTDVADSSIKAGMGSFLEDYESRLNAGTQPASPSDDPMNRFRR